MMGVYSLVVSQNHTSEWAHWISQNVITKITTIRWSLCHTLQNTAAGILTRDHCTAPTLSCHRMRITWSGVLNNSQQAHPDKHISTLQTEDKIGITILKKPKNIEIIIIIIKHNIVYHIYILRSLLIISSSLVSNKNDKKHKTSSLNRGVSLNTWDMWDLGAEPQYITR